QYCRSKMCAVTPIQPLISHSSTTDFGNSAQAIPVNLCAFQSSIPVGQTTKFLGQSVTANSKYYRSKMCAVTPIEPLISHSSTTDFGNSAQAIPVNLCAFQSSIPVGQTTKFLGQSVTANSKYYRSKMCAVPPIEPLLSHSSTTDFGNSAQAIPVNLCAFQSSIPVGQTTKFLGQSVTANSKYYRSKMCAVTPIEPLISHSSTTDFGNSAQAIPVNLCAFQSSIPVGQTTKFLGQSVTANSKYYRSKMCAVTPIEPLISHSSTTDFGNSAQAIPVNLCAFQSSIPVGQTTKFLGQSVTANSQDCRSKMCAVTPIQPLISHSSTTDFGNSAQAIPVNLCAFQSSIPVGQTTKFLGQSVTANSQYCRSKMCAVTPIEPLISQSSTTDFGNSAQAIPVNLCAFQSSIPVGQTPNFLGQSVTGNSQYCRSKMFAVTPIEPLISHSSTTDFGNSAQAIPVNLCAFQSSIPIDQTTKFLGQSATAISQYCRSKMC